MKRRAKTKKPQPSKGKRGSWIHDSVEVIKTVIRILDFANTVIKIILRFW